MSLTTTTLDDIVEAMVTAIQNIASTRNADRRFTTWDEHHDIRVIAVGAAGAECFRRFQIEPLDEYDDVQIVYGDANHFSREIEILVAYPAKLHGLYGETGLRGLRATMAADVRALWTALYNSDNHTLGSVWIPQIERSSIERAGDVWFQRLVVKVQWFEQTVYTITPRPDPSEAPIALGATMWFRSDFGITEQPGNLVSGWQDVSGNEHHTEQSSPDAWPLLVPSIANGHSAVRFGPTAAGKFLPFVEAWPQTDIFSLYAVVRFVRVADYQLLLYSSGQVVNTQAYLSSTGADAHKPYAYAAGGSATWSAALTDGQVYRIRYVFNFTTNVVSVSVNGGAAVQGNASVNILAGNWTAIGSSVGIQHCVSDVLDLVGFESELSAPNETTLQSYFTTRYAL